MRTAKDKERQRESEKVRGSERGAFTQPASFLLLLALPDRPRVPAVGDAERARVRREVARPDLDHERAIDLRGIHVVLGAQDLHLRARVHARLPAQRREAADDAAEARVVERVVREDAGRARVGQDVGVPLLQRVAGEAPARCGARVGWLVGWVRGWLEGWLVIFCFG